MKVLILLLLFFLSPIYGEIITIKHFHEASSALEKSGKNTLIIFDVDNVLIASKDMYLRPQGAHFRRSFWNELTPEDKDHYLSILFNEIEPILVEPVILDVIRQMQKKEVKVIALTAARTGPFGVIKSSENWRVDQLKGLGIDFSSAFPSHEIIDFEKRNFCGVDYPLYKKGILFLGDGDDSLA